MDLKGIIKKLSESDGFLRSVVTIEPYDFEMHSIARKNTINGYKYKHVLNGLTLDKGVYSVEVINGGAAERLHVVVKFNNKGVTKEFYKMLESARVMRFDTGEVGDM